MSEHTRIPRAFTLAAVLLLAACGSSVDIPPATVAVEQQQIHLYALNNTPVGTPSAYDMINLAETQTFRDNSWDFVFDIGPDSAYGLGTTGDTIAVLMPRNHFGFAVDGGLQWTLAPFDSLNIAPLYPTGYDTTKAVRIRAGDVVIAASRGQSCNFGVTRPRYAKVLIQTIDLATLSSIMLLEIDTNCGFRGLGVGIPTQ